MGSAMIVLLFLSCFVISVMMQLTPNVDKLLDWCIDSKHHKSEPGPEGSLYGQCTPWKERSCCQSNTTEQLHLDSLYNFEFNHCPHKASLSAACKRHFVQDHCFYECSPNVGPWTVKETRSWRKERYYKVPLCASDCAAWFDACKDDFTCTDNWSKNFEWIQSKDCPQGGPCKKNICPSGSLCKTFLEIYRTPGNFCEKVWDDAWKYTADDEPCMRIWFDGESGNPNEHVAAWKANLISAGTRLEACSLAVLTGLATFGHLRNIL